jgi:hypothetical protein
VQTIPTLNNSQQPLAPSATPQMDKPEVSIACVCVFKIQPLEVITGD